MVTKSAFKHGLDAFRANPILLVAGLFVGIGTHLQYLEQIIDSKIIAASISFSWVLVFPFIIGGFIGLARCAIGGENATLREFANVARSNYLRLLAGNVAFVFLFVGVAAAFAFAGMIVLVGVVAAIGVIGYADFTPILMTTAGCAWLLIVVGFIISVQFFDVAIVLDGVSVSDGFRRSLSLVRANLRSVVSFSLAWSVLLNLFLLPEYILQLTLAEETAGLPLPSVGIPLAVRISPTEMSPVLSLSSGPLIKISLLLIAIGASAVGFAYLYTVYTVYYMKLTGQQPLEQ